MVECCVLSVEGSGATLLSLGFRVEGFGLRVPGLGFRVSGLGFRALGLGFRVQGGSASLRFLCQAPLGSFHSRGTPGGVGGM